MREFDLQKQLGYNIYRTGLLFRRELIRCFREYEISPEQWQVLVTLWHSKRSLTQAEIGRITLQDAPSISRMIKRMQRNLLVTKTRDKNNERITLIELTSKGRKLQKVLPEKLFDHFEQFLSKFSKQKRSQLNKLLMNLRFGLDDLVS